VESPGGGEVGGQNRHGSDEYEERGDDGKRHVNEFHDDDSHV